MMNSMILLVIVEAAKIWLKQADAIGIVALTAMPI